MAITLRSVKGQALTKEEQEGNIVDLDTRPLGQNYPSDPNIGIKVDNTWPWRTIEPTIRIPGLASDPDLIPYQGNIRQLSFDVGDVIDVELTIPYDYKKETDVYIIVNWSHNSALVTTGGIIAQLEATIAKGFDQEAFGTPQIFNIPQNASIIRYRQLTAFGPISNADGSGGFFDNRLIEPQSSIIASLTLTSNTMDGAATPFVHSVGLLYQSTELGTKNITPDFWV